MGLLDKLLGKGKTPAEPTQAELDAEHQQEVAPDASEGWDAAAHEIDAPGLRARMSAGDDLMLIDVREIWEFSSGNIPGSVNIPLSELGIMVRDLDPEKEYITICAAGMRSLNAAYLLSTHGFEKVQSLAGGMHAWNRE